MRPTIQPKTNEKQPIERPFVLALFRIRDDSLARFIISRVRKNDYLFLFPFSAPLQLPFFLLSFSSFLFLFDLSFPFFPLHFSRINVSKKFFFPTAKSRTRRAKKNRRFLSFVFINDANLETNFRPFVQSGEKTTFYGAVLSDFPPFFPLRRKKSFVRALKSPSIITREVY